MLSFGRGVVARRSLYSSLRPYLTERPSARVVRVDHLVDHPMETELENRAEVAPPSEMTVCLTRPLELELSEPGHFVEPRPQIWSVDGLLFCLPAQFGRTNPNLNMYEPGSN
jgi:hypothetical protein